MQRYAADGVHAKVLECLSALSKRGDLLDVPAGQGALARDAEGLGFRVFPGDLASDNIVYRNGRCVGIDLSKPLPFRDQALECVMCVEGIEHLKNPFFAVGEFVRVLKKGGYLIITTPNVMSFNSRMTFLLRSHLDYFRYYGPLPPEARYRPAGYEHGHVTPIPYPKMRYMLEECGFTIESIEASRKVKKWRVLRIFLKPVIKHKTLKRCGDSFYTSDVLLEGEVLVFVAKK